MLLRGVVVVSRGRMLVRSKASLSYIGKRAYSNDVEKEEPEAGERISEQEKKQADRNMLAQLRLAIAQKPEQDKSAPGEPDQARPRRTRSSPLTQQGPVGERRGPQGGEGREGRGQPAAQQGVPRPASYPPQGGPAPAFPQDPSFSPSQPQSQQPQQQDPRGPRGQRAPRGPPQPPQQDDSRPPPLFPASAPPPAPHMQQPPPPPYMSEQRPPSFFSGPPPQPSAPQPYQPQGPPSPPPSFPSFSYSQYPPPPQQISLPPPPPQFQPSFTSNNGSNTNAVTGAPTGSGSGSSSSSSSTPSSTPGANDKYATVNDIIELRNELLQKIRAVEDTIYMLNWRR